MSIISKELTIGSDPELFLFDPHTQQFVSAIDRIGGSKWNPLPMDKPGFFIQEDNVLVEFNIPPAKNEAEFVSFITEGINMVKQRAQGLELKIQSSAFMPAEVLQDPRALIFGCDPDRNAWTGQVNKPPHDDVKKQPLRSAGGHIAAGYTLLDKDVNKMEVDRNIVCWLDLHLGVPSILMDSDKHRRTLYGKAGAYRSKPWGVEYRTLSSFWLASEPLIKWAYQNTIKAVEKAGNSMFIPADLGQKIQECINNADETLAKQLCAEYQLDVY